MDVIEAAGGVVWRDGDRGQPEVVVVHRPKYDDWSLPKGKLTTADQRIAGNHPEIDAACAQLQR